MSVGRFDIRRHAATNAVPSRSRSFNAQALKLQPYYLTTAWPIGPPRPSKCPLTLLHPQTSLYPANTPYEVCAQCCGRVAATTKAEGTIAVLARNALQPGQLAIIPSTVLPNPSER